MGSNMKAGALPYPGPRLWKLPPASAGVQNEPPWGAGQALPTSQLGKGNA